MQKCLVISYQQKYVYFIPFLLVSLPSLLHDSLAVLKQQLCNMPQIRSRSFKIIAVSERTKKQNLASMYIILLSNITSII